jgi:hypothetical protein
VHLVETGDERRKVLQPAPELAHLGTGLRMVVVAVRSMISPGRSHLRDVRVGQVSGRRAAQLVGQARPDPGHVDGEVAQAARDVSAPGRCAAFVRSGWSGLIRTRRTMVCLRCRPAKGGDGPDPRRSRGGRPVAPPLAAAVPVRAGAVAGHRRGHVPHRERDLDPDPGPARQLPRPGHVRRLGLGAPGHRGADHELAAHDVRRRRRAGRARRLGAGGVPARPLAVAVPRRRAHRGGGQARRARRVHPPADHQVGPGRDDPRRVGRLRLRRLRVRRLRLHRAVHRRRSVRAAGRPDRTPARPAGAGRARPVDRDPGRGAVRGVEPGALPAHRRTGPHLPRGGAAARPVELDAQHRPDPDPGAERAPLRPRAGRLARTAHPGAGGPRHRPAVGWLGSHLRGGDRLAGHPVAADIVRRTLRHTERRTA